MGDVFVGRVECTEKFKAAWNDDQYKIFGIYGPKSVGKTRYVENFLAILSASEKGNKVKTVTLDFHNIKTYKGYVETAAGYFNIQDHEACSHTSCKCIQKIIKFLKDSGDVYIFHHDHQEEAKFKLDSEGNLQDSAKQTLWDQIYAEVMKPLLTECNSFYLIISSTDEFRFAQLRKTFWMQKIPALTENESMELLNDVWPSSADDIKSCQHIVKLCDGIPPAIINAGLLMKDDIMSAEEVIESMVKQIIEVLSDEFLPHPERINSHLQHRWKHLSEEHGDNLVKTLMIIKYTSQLTIAANAKLFKCNTVADYKFNRLLPLLRRNLLSYNKDDETVSPCPMIQHILEAVSYIKADEIRQELKEQIKAILEPQVQSGTDWCNSDSKAFPLSPDSIELPKDCCTCPQNSVDIADRANQYASQRNICQETLRENKDLRARGPLKCSSKVPVENESIEKPPSNFKQKSSGRIQGQEIGLDDSESNPNSRQNSFIAQNLNRKSLENEKGYEGKDIRNTKFSLSSEHMFSETVQSRLHHEKNNHESYPTHPQENAENNLSIDDNTTSLPSEHSELISRGPMVSQLGKSQSNSSIDKSYPIPAVTLSGEYEFRQTEKPEDSSALPFSGESTPNFQTYQTDQCPDVTLSGIGSISMNKSNKNTQDCLRPDINRCPGVTLSDTATSCAEKHDINSSPFTFSNPGKPDIDQGPCVTISGVYSATNSENNKIFTKDSHDLTVSKPNDKEEANVLRIVPKSPVQVSEESDGVNCTFANDGFSCPLGQLNATAGSNNTELPLRNAPSNYSQVLDLTEGPTRTKNMGFNIHEASSPSKEAVPQSLNNQKLNIQNSKPISEIKTSRFHQSIKTVTGIPCEMGTEDLSGSHYQPQSHLRTLNEDITKRKDTLKSQATISSAQSDEANDNTSRAPLTSGNTTHMEHDGLSSEESMTNNGASRSTENENPEYEVERDHVSDASVVTSLPSSFFSKALDLYNSLE